MSQLNKYFIIISIILNAILLMTLFGVIPFFLYLSLLINIGLIWFSRKVLSRTEESLEDLETIFSTTYDLQIHLQSIYQLETFYGDETLRGLIQHILEANEEIEEIKEKYSTEEEQYDVSLEEENPEEAVNFDPTDQKEA
jgi:hypothetical protein